MIRVVIAGGSALMREGLAHILRENPSIALSAEARNGYEVITLVGIRKFDVLLLDPLIAGVSGIELIRWLKSKVPQMCILVFSTQSDDPNAIPTIRAGARGFLDKSTTIEQLYTAIYSIAAGRHYVSESVYESLALQAAPAEVRSPHTLLSEREYSVFKALVAGRTNTQIAVELAISVKTVSTHKVRIMEKMGMTTMPELVQYAIREQLLPTVIPSVPSSASIQPANPENID
jgi:DNA-binding NarL/FixJ family response regulator